MRRYLIILICIFVLTGCAIGGRAKQSRFNAYKLIQVSMGLSKDQVQASLGKPNAVRQAAKSKEGETIEIWEYIETGSFWRGKTEEAYAVYFKDGLVYKWGRPKDWIYKP
ncbi:MAG: hypothetical protein AUJ75_01660 [Candidatus Omnitrophica bacterium CG1_02_49_10]|nr:MAG: hypothetical protein AUJ75_01660 [Candidatus Omnitrophica bacterium CG1_02_49_10]